MPETTQVLDYQEGEVYSYQFPYRGMKGILINGVYNTSSAADIGGFYPIHFDKGTYEEERLAYMEHDYYEVEGVEVTAEEFYRYTEALRNNLGDGLAEIRYYGAAEERLDYRKSMGEEDNSGVYLEFDRVQEEEANGIQVTLKGDADRVYLILWQKDGFSYSIYGEEGIPIEEAAEWLEGWIR